ncbi:Ube2u protein [Apodemus speciosus]|uniref:Ube2u protein n=1 Tax=Apodemus speciosus TaxID=105296 RepID=A0ABQ0ENP3_APOSI
MMLLSYPILKNPVNLEAAQLLIKDESTYKIVLQELLPSASPKRAGSLVLAEKPKERISIVKTISFNDYYKTCDKKISIVGKPSKEITSRWCKTTEQNKQPTTKNVEVKCEERKKSVGKNCELLEIPISWDSITNGSSSIGSIDCNGSRKFVLSKWQTARKKVMVQDSSDPYDEGTVVYPSPTELSVDHEIEGKPGFYELPQEWPEESLPDEHDSKESWEEEVDNLVTWSNGLDEESLNYESYENVENYENVGN